ncbi:SPOR domain-containing protein [Kangiella marina]|uniref:SPOR domain-containing protein n=1 Tax=Kangiella marina TaxID=1079178 RepID=A0ABP8IGM9_9GAMM
MAFSQSLNPNVFEKHNRVLFLPSSWKRLMSLIKYQVPNGGFAVMEGEFGAGKSAFGRIFEKKLVLDENIDCQIVQVHPLSTIQQIQAQLPKDPEKPMLVIIDDAHEASTLLLQKLTVPTKNIYWFLLAEPGISERVDAFEERRVELPLFSKEDCFEFLQKQLQDQPKYVQVSQMQSDTIWYSSEGLPKEIIEHAKKNLSKLFSGHESSENFDKANKSWYMTAGLGAAALIFIIFLAISMGGPEDEEGPDATNEVEEVKTADIPTDDSSSLPIDTTKTAEDRVAKQESEKNTPADGNEVSALKNPSTEVEQVAKNSVSEEAMDGKTTAKGLTSEEVKEASESADPIESIALKVAKKESVVKAQPNVSKSFSQWLSSHSQDTYSLQLFSHSEKAAAKSFQGSLDLADSYVYPADIEGKIRYRVLWGAFKTRAEAQQAIDSLPSEILAQKPWIRQFSAISQEVSTSAN